MQSMNLPQKMISQQLMSCKICANLAAVLQLTPRQSFPARQNSGSAALDALIATAQREEPADLPAPQLLEIEEVPTRRPLEVEAPRRVQRPRNRGNVPPRNRDRPRNRPDGEESVVANGGARRRPASQREDPVATLERYSHKNDDGSFTFGYVGADGSFREETRGADCITRGKYGYIDPDGVKREYTYTSGLPCEVGEDGEGDLQNLDIENSVEDTISARERFRQTQNEQLDNSQIPQIRQQQIADRQRGSTQRGERPAARPRPTAAPQQANTFSNFGQGGSQGNALQNLLTIADPAPAPAPVRRPAPTRGPIRIATRPVQPAPQPAQKAPGTFNFDSELEGFTLNRPAIKFDNAGVAAPVQNQFESQLSFNQNTGVFQTSLQQNLPGGGVINTQNGAAPTGQAAATRAPRPPQQPTTRAPPTTITLGTTIGQTGTTARPQAVLPAGTIQLQPTFQPLNVPKDISQVKVAPKAPVPAEAPRSASPAPVVVVPKPTLAPKVVPAPVPQAAPAPVPQAAPAPVPQAVPAPAPSPVPQAAPAPPATPKPNKFFVFQPFNQKPASKPFRTPVNPDAFVIKPQAAPARPPQSPPTLISQGGRPVPASQAVPAPLRPAPAPVAPQRPQAPRAPSAPIPQSQLPPGVFAVPAGQPIPAGAIRVNPQGQAINSQGQLIPEPARAPVPEQPRRPAAAPQTPQLQFGFQPVSQGAPQPQRPAPQSVPRPVAQPPRPPVGAPRPAQSRPAPFTAFGSGPARPVAQAPQFQARPQQLGVPPQLQQPGQFSQFDSRFAPRPQGGVPSQQFRPAQFQPGQQGFNVFNPSALRGA